VGHLLGTCSISLQAQADSTGPRLVFSGDVGRQSDLLMPPPEPPPPADVLIVESTYGNRIHPADEDSARLGEIIQTTVRHGGSVLMPAFAVGRAQALLLVLQRLKRSGAIPLDLPIFLDSPMAIEATALYRQYARLLRVPAREMRGLTDGVRMVATAQQSQRLTALRYPGVIIASSGMATGGRVLNHLKAMAPDARHSIVFAGFQVGGSRGARMVGGEREIKVHGELVPVRAQVRQLEGFSGHADKSELMAWLAQIETPPRQTFVVHGEPDASDTLRSAIKDHLHWPVRVPAYRECVEV
jgi:metallo-beta-lactamase family protein